MIENQIKTVLLLASLTGLLLFIGSFWGYSGMTIAFVFAILMNVGSYWFSDKIVLAMYRAKEVKEKEHPNLFRIVKEVSSEAGIPMPKVYIVPTDNSNAFATGRSPKKSAVAVTNGIMNLLNEHELKGVIAHEISHIKNRDTLIQTVSATIAGVISYIAFMARWGALFGGFGRDRDSGNIAELLVLAILTPIVATVIQLAISRSREFLADERAAKTLKDSSGLASALQKLESSARAHPLRFGNKATSSLFIVSPFRGGALLSLFNTHPKTELRVKKLNEIKF